MSLRSCPRERELADHLHSGHWPQACPADLLDHVTGCRACSDLLAATLAFRRIRSDAVATVCPEPAGAIWWRAQLRRRNSAIRRIRKPILGAQLFAATVVLLAAIAFLSTQAALGHRLLTWIAALRGTLHFDVLVPSSLPTSSGTVWLLVPILAMLAIVGGVFVCLASDKH